MVIYGYLWQFKAIYGILWLSMVIYAYLWHFAAVYGIL